MARRNKQKRTARGEIVEVKPEERELDEREKDFVLYYLASRRLSPEDAAIRAGYSRSTARRESWDILRRPHIQRAIAAAIAERNERLQVEADEVLLELQRVAYGRLDQVAEWSPDGLTPHDSETLSDQAASIVKSITVTEDEKCDRDGNVTVKRKFGVVLHDKVKALQLLAMHQGLLKQVVEVKGKMTLDQVVAAGALADEEGDL